MSHSNYYKSYGWLLCGNSLNSLAFYFWGVGIASNIYDHSCAWSMCLSGLCFILSIVVSILNTASAPIQPPNVLDLDIDLPHVKLNNKSTTDIFINGKKLVGGECCCGNSKCEF